MDTDIKLVTIDSNGDTFITLKDPDTALLRWRSEKELIRDIEELIADKPLSTTEEELWEEIQHLISSEEDVLADEELLLSQDQPSAAVHDGEQNSREKKEGHVTRDEANEVRFLVSSRQLRIVSPYFDNTFKRDYSETVPCLKDGLYHVQAQHWSKEAFGVILSISHQQVKAIPKEVTPALFAHILMAADYYQMGDVLAIYAEKWW